MMWRKITTLLGKRSFRWMSIGFVGSLLLIVVEFSVVIFLQLLMVSLGVSEATMLPNWLPQKVMAASLSSLLIGFVVVGVFRFIAYSTVELSAGFVEQLVQARLRFLTIHELLFKNEGRLHSSSEVHHRLGEIIPNVSFFAKYLVFAAVYATVAVLLLGMMYVLHPYEALSGSGGLLGIGLLILLLNKKARKNASDLPALFKQIETGVVRVSRNFFLIRILQTQKQESTQFNQSIHNYYAGSVRSLLLSTLASNMAPLLGIILLTGIIALSHHIWQCPIAC